MTLQPPFLCRHSFAQPASVILARPVQAQRICFSSYAALAQEELMEVVDFFLKPQRFRRSGAKIPRGVLLCGPPGS